jgi:hypothetical protein
MAKTSGKTTSSDGFKLPQYLRLAKGVMWFDTEGEKASGVKLFAGTTKLVGRGKINEEVVNGKWTSKADQPSIPNDKNHNNNFMDYGYVNVPVEEISWYVDTTKIPTEKQSRLILAYKHKILVETDPKKLPETTDVKEQTKNFQNNKKGDRVFVGKNKEIFKRLQNLKVAELRDFINACPKTEAGKNNLIDMYHYEIRGYNKLSRARLEVLDLIRNRLKEFGPTMSAIRINED